MNSDRTKQIRLKFPLKLCVFVGDSSGQPNCERFCVCYNHTGVYMYMCVCIYVCMCAYSAQSFKIKGCYSGRGICVCVYVYMCGDLGINSKTPNRMLTRRLLDTKCINASPRIRLHASILLKIRKKKNNKR